MNNKEILAQIEAINDRINKIERKNYDLSAIIDEVSMSDLYNIGRKKPLTIKEIRVSRRDMIHQAIITYTNKGNKI